MSDDKREPPVLGIPRADDAVSGRVRRFTVRPLGSEQPLGFVWATSMREASDIWCRQRPADSPAHYAVSEDKPPGEGTVYLGQADVQQTNAERLLHSAPVLPRAPERVWKYEPHEVVNVWVPDPDGHIASVSRLGADLADFVNAERDRREEGLCAIVRLTEAMGGYDDEGGPQPTPEQLKEREAYLEGYKDAEHDVLALRARLHAITEQRERLLKELEGAYARVHDAVLDRERARLECNEAREQLRRTQAHEIAARPAREPIDIDRVVDSARAPEALLEEVKRAREHVSKLRATCKDLAGKLQEANKRAVLERMADTRRRDVFAFLRTFSDRDRACAWLMRPHPKLGLHTPLSTMLAGDHLAVMRLLEDGGLS